MSEKTWDMIYDAIMDLTKTVINLLTEIRTELNDVRNEMITRFDRLEERVINIESDLTYTKVNLFDTEKELHVLKDRRS